MTIEDKIDAFKKTLKDSSISDKDFVQRYLVHGITHVFGDDEDKHFQLKNKIAINFKLDPNNIIIVGSSKLGFSIAPDKLWKKFDDESDIDAVIISEDIFRNFWTDLHNMNIWTQPRTTKEEKNYFKFLEYFFKGWIRPDLFPFNYSKKEDWFEFFKSLSYNDFGNRKITGAIFYNWYFFNKYHIDNIKSIRIGVS